MSAAAEMRLGMRDSPLRNKAPIASHLLYTQPGLLNDSIYAERQLGIEAGYVWMLRADLVAFYVNFGWAPGILDARAFAESINLPITFRLITCAPPIK